jgi:hypothetical protein
MIFLTVESICILIIQQPNFTCYQRNLRGMIMPYAEYKNKTDIIILK